MPSFKPKSQEEFGEEFRRRVMTGYFSGSRREKFLVEWIVKLAEESAGRRQKLGSQGAGEDGTRRLQLQKTHGVGERTIPVPESIVLSCDIGRDVISSVETTFSKQTFSHQPGFLSKSPRGSVSEENNLLEKFHLEGI